VTILLTCCVYLTSFFALSGHDAIYMVFSKEALVYGIGSVFEAYLLSNKNMVNIY
jgi:hypothetical protein